jgi:NAD(P)-dependent dehydrogenase (short-subunit alcohol dehydrogenase family)
VAIVTGASSGIGEATARELARRGASVTLAARRLDRLENLAADLERTSGRPHLAIQTDVAEREQLERMVEQTLDRFGKLDVLVNNAGIASPRRALDSSEDAIRQLFAVNVIAPLRAIQIASPHLPRGGVIVNVGSIAGEAPVPGLYSVTKAALRSLSYSLRAELARRGIAVVLVEPGFIRTPFNARMRSRILMPGPEVAARAIAGAVEHPRRTVIVPAWYAPLVYLMRSSPDWLWDHVLRLRRLAR